MNFKLKIFTILAVVITLSSCKKYYLDSGVHEAKYNGTMLQYMASKKPVFDTTLMVIKLAGMENMLSDDSKPVTFFAPLGGSIARSIIRLNRELKNKGKDTVSQLSQISTDVWRANLSMYILDGKYLLKDFPQRDTANYAAFPGQGYSSIGGRIMNIGVIFNDAVIKDSKGVITSTVPYAGYRQLFCAYIPDLANPLISLVNAPVASSDIQPTNGVIHVLTKQTHNFGFNTDTFIDQVISKGISPPTQ
jgi:hypothetical protein